MEQLACSVLFKLVILFFTPFTLQALTESLNCTFDDGFCDWTLDTDDDFDWQRVESIDSSSAPELDHTTGYGYYIYLRARFRQEGDSARISNPIQKPGPFCLTLWYNMNGRVLGTLNIYVKTINGSKSLIFTKYTSIGSRCWQKAVISRRTNIKFQVELEGVRGSSFFGDIAVDDISMTDGKCTVDCNFEFGLCHWVQDLSDDFDWNWNQGGTNTPNTGPPADHSFGHGYYIYIDTSEVDNGTSARILSPWLREGKYCFSFWYYMYGEHVETLTVQTADVNKIRSEIVEITGEQKQQWIQEHTFIHATSDFQIIIEGTVRNNLNHDNGDIALDDVQLLSCQETTKTSALTYIYVTVLLAAVVLVISLMAVIWRKRILRYCAVKSSHSHVKKEQPKPKTVWPNMAYSGNVDENRSSQDGDLSQDDEYDVVTNDRHETGQSKTHTYIDGNTADAAITTIKEIEHLYNHTTNSGILATDNTYSHLAGHRNISMSNYKTTEFLFSGNRSSKLSTNPRNNNYDCLRTKEPKKSFGLDVPSDMKSDQDPEYDHAQAGWTVPREIDDYSHLNMVTDKP